MIYTDKIKSWLPEHFKTAEYEPYINAVSDVFELFKNNLDQLYDETFLTMANTEYLNVLGEERGIIRTVIANKPESDVFYSNRIRRIKYNRTKQNIILNAISVASVTDIIVINDLDSDFMDGLEDKRSSNVVIESTRFGNYGPLDLTRRKGCFSVLIRTPVPELLNYYDSEAFFDDEVFTDEIIIFQEAFVDELKFLIKQKIPAGAGFRLLINGFDGIVVGDEASQEEELNSL